MARSPSPDLEEDRHMLRPEHTFEFLDYHLEQQAPLLTRIRNALHIGRPSKHRQHADAPPERLCLRVLKTILLIPLLVLSIFGLLHLLRSYLAHDPLFFPPPPAPLLWSTYPDYLSAYPTDATRDVAPIPCHSHNDYWRPVPLFSALAAGCTSVEADIWLKHDELYIGHSLTSLTRNRTLHSLYVAPLAELLEKQNPSTEFATVSGHGVFDEVPEQTLVLLVDFKTPGSEAWPYLLAALDPLREKGHLTTWTPAAGLVQRAVTVVATGAAAFADVQRNSTYRDVFYDAPLAALDDGVYDGTNSYLASVALPLALGPVPRGGVFSPHQLQRMDEQVARAKERGLVPRYWDTPAWPVMLRNRVWTQLVAHGVGLLNVDDLAGAASGDWDRIEHGIV